MKNKFLVSATLLAAVFTMGLTACGEGNTDDGAQDPPETAVTHSYGADGVCTDCGYVDMSKLDEASAIAKYGYYVVDKDESGTYTAGDIVSFGSYPQDLVEDSAVLAALDGLKGTLPSAEGGGDWISYGYYDGGAVADYAYYKDVESGGVKYRGVYLTAYRPYYSGLSADAEHSYIDESFSTEQVYWFAYSPVRWTLLAYKDGVMFLNAQRCIEAQPFQDVYGVSGSDYVIEGSETYVNDWESCSLRTFLNGTFYDTAFGEAEKALIQTATLDNKTTGYAADAQYQVNQNNTQDKVFLLSYADVKNTDYGYTAKGASRQRSFTDYSLIQGLRPSGQSVTPDGDPACLYIVRSAGEASYNVCAVSKLGAVASTTDPVAETDVDGLAFNGDSGILPAIYVKIW
ncbi:MAG: DUF6273 domain-containing protein [Candidatus Coproplasma sp.]